MEIPNITGCYMNWEHEERRKSPSVEDIVRAAVATLKEETSVLTPEEHSFVKTLLEREKRKAEMWEKIKVHALGWGLVGFVGWIGKAVLDAFRIKFGG